jgi:hypothetical protein
MKGHYNGYAMNVYYSLPGYKRLVYHRGDRVKCREAGDVQTQGWLDEEGAIFRYFSPAP